jgi:peptide/nickel transport system substrate-binding protein
MRKHLLAVVAAIAATFATGAVQADEIVIGLASEPSSIDPHYHNLGPNNAMRRHIFEALIGQDAKQRLGPELAESWRTVDDTTWEFKLRKGVKFHDGSDFTAKDFVYSVCRVPNVPNSPSSFTIYTKAIEAIETPDPHTLVIRTAKPHPLLPVELSLIAILPAGAFGATGDITYAKEGCGGVAEWPKSEDFNNGKLAIGTGAFKFVEFVKGDRIVLAKNPDYWGEKPDWDKVTFRPITSDGPRVAALLAGDVQLIDKPPVQDLPRLEKDPDLEVVKGLSNRVIYLHFDHFQEPTPGIKGTNGKNPFKDLRVRQAVSKAIDRKAIVERIMQGVAVPANQLLPPGMFGHNTDLQVEPYDPEGAKQLLAEAGYPDGFELVIGTPNDRYINDDKVAQAVAQMLTKVGIKTSVDASTKSVFFKRRNQYEFSLYLAGWGSGTGEMSSPLRALVASQNKEKGYGGTNRGRYSNAKLDGLVEVALATVDDAKREGILRQASAVVMQDYGILPLHFEVTPWAFRKGLLCEARADQYTLATGVRKAK